VAHNDEGRIDGDYTTGRLSTIFEKTQRTFAFHVIEKVELRYILLGGRTNKTKEPMSAHPKWMAELLGAPWLQP